MNNNQGGGGGGLLYLFGIIVAGYAVIETVNAVVLAITALLMGLVNILLIASGILAAYWIYRYISDKQFGDDKKERRVHKLEQKKKEVTKRLPKHIRGVAKDFYEEQEKEIYETKPKIARSDAVLDKTKQVINIFRRGE